MFRYVLVSILLLMASPALAVSFDIWKTGLSRQEIESMAKQHNLPLAKHKGLTSAKAFDPLLVSGETNNFYYRTTLLNHSAFVNMYLSPKKGNYAQFLYEIDIQFSNKGDFRSYLVKLLEDKYGPGIVKADIIREILVWHPEKDGEITLITTPALLQLLYTDTKIKAFAVKLQSSTYDLPEKPMSHKDAERF